MPRKKGKGPIFSKYDSGKIKRGGFGGKHGKSGEVTGTNVPLEMPPIKMGQEKKKKKK